MAVDKLVGSAIGGAIGAYVVYEIINAISYSGPGQELMSLFAFVVIAVAIMNMLDDGM